ncbi:hypothetical protein K2X33_06750, partial [bacterium]|nr:hypothetical protein [bacterium]
MLKRFLSLDWPDRLLVGGLVLVAALYAVSLGALSFVVGPYDYNHLSTYYEIARRFWWEQSGLPAYDPFFCGGRTLGADPQIPIFHPLVLFSFLLGPVVTLRLEILAQLGVGCWGLWHWLKRWEVSPSGRGFGLLAFSAGGFTLAHVLAGHVTLGFYFLLPAYFVLSYRLSSARRWDPWALCGLLWLFVYCGLYKPNFFIHAVPPLLAEALARSIFARSLKPLGYFLLAVGTAGLACAVSLWPAQEYFSLFPRGKDARPRLIPVWTLFANLLLPLKAVPEAWYGSVYLQRHEYSVFLGPVAVWFAWLGRRSDTAEKRALWVFAGFSALLGLGFSGSFSPFLPFSWLHPIWPGFDSIRVPVRFWYGVFLAVVVFSASGFRWPASRWAQWLCVFFGVLPFVAQAAVNLGKINAFSTGVQWEPQVHSAPDITLTHESPDEPYAAIRSGRGVIECVDNIPTYRANVLKAAPLLQFESTPHQIWLLTWLNWSRLRLRGDLTQATKLVLNFNHHPFWKTTVGEITSQPGDRLTLQMPPGPLDAFVTFEQPRVA